MTTPIKAISGGAVLNIPILPLKRQYTIPDSDAYAEFLKWYNARETACVYARMHAPPGTATYAVLFVNCFVDEYAKAQAVEYAKVCAHKYAGVNPIGYAHEAAAAYRRVYPLAAERALSYFSVF